MILATQKKIRQKSSHIEQIAFSSDEINRPRQADHLSENFHACLITGSKEIGRKISIGDEDVNIRKFADTKR
jgi:hypothetical protein